MNILCLYCNHLCVEKYHAVLECVTCKVEYLLVDVIPAVTHQQYDKVKEISFYIDKSGVRYCIDLRLTENVTRVRYHLPYANYFTTILTINHIVKGITPQNAADKLQTLLTFQ